MKFCNDCRETKPLSEFNKKGGGLQHRCRMCQKIWYKNYYDSSDKEINRLRKKNLQRKISVREVLNRLKDVPCTDCGLRYPPFVMDFDHLGDKNFNIGFAASRAIPIKKVMDEIAKCEIVCSNCHRYRTNARRVVGIPL